MPSHVKGWSEVPFRIKASKLSAVSHHAVPCVVIHPKIARAKLAKFRKTLRVGGMVDDIDRLIAQKYGGVAQVDWRHFLGTPAQKADLQPLNRSREIIPPRERTSSASGRRASADKTSTKAATARPSGKGGDRHDDHDDEDDEDASGDGSQEGTGSDDGGSGRRHASSSGSDAAPEAPTPPAPAKGIPHRKKVGVSHRVKGKQLALSDDDTSGGRPSISPETAKRTTSKRSKNDDAATAPTGGGLAQRSVFDDHAENMARMYAEIDDFSPRRGDAGTGVGEADDGANTDVDFDINDFGLDVEELDDIDGRRPAAPAPGKVARCMRLPTGSGGPSAALANMSPLDAPAPPTLEGNIKTLDNRRHEEALMIELIESTSARLRRSAIVSRRLAYQVAEGARSGASSEELVATRNSLAESELRRAELEAELKAVKAHWAARQQTWSSREQELASREQQFTSREQQFTSREQEFTSREQEFSTHKQDWASREQAYVENEKKSSSLLTTAGIKFKELAAKYQKLKSSCSCSSQASRRD